MATTSQNYTRWIKGFTKEQFDILVKKFVELYWKVDEIVNIDGTGDGGIDIKIFESKRRV